MSAGSGLLLSLAFPSWAFPSLHPWTGWIAWFALVPMLHAIDAAGKRYSFLAGWTGGTVFFGSALYWMASIREMEYMAIPAWLMFSAFLGAFWGLWGWGMAAAGKRGWMAGPALWILLEWVRGHIFTGFPWVVLGTSQWGMPWLFLSSRIAGVMAVSAAIVSVNIAIVFLALRHYPLRYAVGQGAAFSLLLFALSLLANASIVADQSSGKRVRIAVLQGSFTAAEKDLLPQEAMLDRFEVLAKRAGKENPEIMVWPETATASELSGDTATVIRLIRLARSTKSVQVVGAILSENLHYYNAAYVVSGSGYEIPFRKRHLVPFGEYIPGFIRTMIPFLRKLTAGVVDYTPGRDSSPAITGPVRSGVQVCYEAIFPEIAREQARAGAEVFLNLTNDAWYGRTAATFQHALGPVSRAVENGRWMVRCANTGYSFFASPDGKVSSRLGIFEPGYAVHEVVAVSTVTPCARFGDFPALIMATLLLVFSLFQYGEEKDQRAGLARPGRRP